jgi:uncharacterized membrane protein
MSDPLGLILRIAHIFCGMFWAGAAIMLAAFIGPAIRALGPTGGKFMERLMGPGRFGLYMTVASLITVATGLATMGLRSGGSHAMWLASGHGRTIIIGSVAGLVALVSGLAVDAPAAARLARIGREIEGAGGPPRDDHLAEMSRLRSRLHTAELVSAILLSISVIAMAAARYM